MVSGPLYMIIPHNTATIQDAGPECLERGRRLEGPKSAEHRLIERVILGGIAGHHQWHA